MIVYSMGFSYGIYASAYQRSAYALYYAKLAAA